MIDVANRTAVCGCGKSSPSSSSLPFFEYRGPGSIYGRETCKNCHYIKIAHNYAPYFYPGQCLNCQGNLYFQEETGHFYCASCFSKFLPETLNTAISPISKCPGFESIGEADDKFYCGHSGWE